MRRVKCTDHLAQQATDEDDKHTALQSCEEGSSGNGVELHWIASTISIEKHKHHYSSVAGCAGWK
eukprot:scaffold5703_cov35-Tisochrysis_lutea.AAC.1